MGPVGYLSRHIFGDDQDTPLLTRTWRSGQFSVVFEEALPIWHFRNTKIVFIIMKFHIFDYVLWLRTDEIKKTQFAKLHWTLSHGFGGFAVLQTNKRRKVAVVLICVRKIIPVSDTIMTHGDTVQFLMLKSSCWNSLFGLQSIGSLSMAVIW